MQKEEFHKRYRERLELDALEAPADVWNNISAALDGDEANLGMDASELSLIDEVWNNIESELDIDEVWGKIDEKLEKEDKSPVFLQYRRWLAAAVLLLLVGLVSLMHIFTSDVTQPLTAKKHQYNEQSNKATPKQQDEAEKSVETLSDICNDSVLKKSDDASLLVADTKKNDIATLLRDEPDAIATITRCPDEESSNIAHSPMSASGSFSMPQVNLPLERKGAFIELPNPINLAEASQIKNNEITNTYWMASFRPVNFGEPVEKLPYDRKDSKWTTGVIAAVKNTYLLNHETLDGFSPSGMNSASLTFQPDLGLNVQYALTQRYILESNIFVSSSASQNYHFYTYGEYVSKEMQLNYMASEVLIKQNSKRSYLKDKLIRRNVAGVYVAHMNSATEKVSNDLQDVSSRYATLDYGVMLGQEFELLSNGPVKISTGITLKYGLPNVYQGDANIPANFNKTHNASVEFRVGLAYRWKAKVGIDHYLGSLFK